MSVALSCYRRRQLVGPGRFQSFPAMATVCISPGAFTGKLERIEMAELATSSGRDANDRQRALDAAIGQIERAFGKGSVMKLGQRGPAIAQSAVTT